MPTPTDAEQSPGAAEETANRLYLIIGKALCQMAEQSPSIEIIIQMILEHAATDDGEREFLRSKGWLS